MKNSIYVLHLDAGHGVNGNPRRCFVIADYYRGFLMAIDEGYQGTKAIGMELKHLGKEQLSELDRRLTKIPVAPKFYREVMRDYGDGGEYRKEI